MSSGRSEQSQADHDRRVKSLAENLIRQGFSVQADLKGYDQPSTFNGLRPDVIGRKPGGERVIYEVETRDSVSTPQADRQKNAFEEAAVRNPKTTFRRYMA
jgi:hypothetical protein